MSRRDKTICPDIQRRIQAAFEAAPNARTGLRPAGDVLAGLRALWRARGARYVPGAASLPFAAIVCWAERLCALMCKHNRPILAKLAMLSDTRRRLAVLAALGGEVALAAWERRKRKAEVAAPPIDHEPEPPAAHDDVPFRTVRPIRIVRKTGLRPPPQIRFCLPALPRTGTRRMARTVIYKGWPTSLHHAPHLPAIPVTPAELRGETEIPCLKPYRYPAIPARPSMCPLWSRALYGERHEALRPP